MLTEEDDVEIHALARRGWSVSAIARHTGRDRKTVSKYLAGPAPAREPAPSCLEPFRDYLVARFVDDPHVDGTVLHREVVEFGFDRSYVTFVRQLRLLELRPRCEACRTGGHGVTVELAHDRVMRSSSTGSNSQRRRGVSRRTFSSAPCRSRGAAAAWSARA